MHPDSDEELLERIRRGERTALAHLYSRYKVHLFRFCLHLLKNEAQAEDAVHDTFVKICNGAHTVGNPGSFRGWIFQIARNEALMNLRQRKASSDDGLDDVWDEETPLTLLVDKDISGIVHQMMSRLRIEYREVLMLREYEQLSYTEIARITGATESAVKSRLFKARQALAKNLEPMMRERAKS
ncbi:MAG: RNA polymerase sigma factor [Bacteroidetes bacterium]|nr:RNA polymerase sigma factor [Bacteroidota bacterium]MCW5895654.1 RNA polymerase sigma factor [Bacteroidota bacterium]